MKNDLFDPKMLEVLVCPQTGGQLELSADRSELVCRSAKRAYPIISGVPILIASEARELTETERAKLKTSKR